jgi:hypothetical protein
MIFDSDDRGSMRLRNVSSLLISHTFFFFPSRYSYVVLAPKSEAFLWRKLHKGGSLKSHFQTLPPQTEGTEESDENLRQSNRRFGQDSNKTPPNMSSHKPAGQVIQFQFQLTYLLMELSPS